MKNFRVILDVSIMWSEFFWGGTDAFAHDRESLHEWMQPHAQIDPNFAVTWRAGSRARLSVRAQDHRGPPVRGRREEAHHGR